MGKINAVLAIRQTFAASIKAADRLICRKNGSVELVDNPDVAFYISYTQGTFRIPRHFVSACITYQVQYVMVRNTYLTKERGFLLITVKKYI